MKKILTTLSLTPLVISSCNSAEQTIFTTTRHYLGYGALAASIEEGGNYNLIIATASYDVSEGLSDQERITVSLSETNEFVSTKELGYELTANDINEQPRYINTLFEVTDATKDTSIYSFKTDVEYEWDEIGGRGFQFETGISKPAEAAFNSRSCSEIAELEFDLTVKDGSDSNGISGATNVSDTGILGSPFNWSLYLASLQDVALEACRLNEV